MSKIKLDPSEKKLLAAYESNPSYPSTINSFSPNPYVAT